MRVKYSVPSDLDQLKAAGALADSVLRIARPSTTTDAKFLASLAALTGQANLAARYAHAAEAPTAAPAIERSGPALLAFAAMGGPVDSLKRLEPALRQGIESGVLPSERETATEQWLSRPGFLAIPNYRFASAADYNRGRRYQSLVIAWRDGDLRQAKRIMAALRDERRRGGVRAWDVTVDAVYGEAAILASLSDPEGAIGWLDPLLDSLAFVPPQRFIDVARAGPFVRAMALRADLANERGDTARSKKWAQSVIALWSHPDVFLQPTVDRMRRLAR
jgi:hypothetical protein